MQRAAGCPCRTQCHQAAGDLQVERAGKDRAHLSEAGLRQDESRVDPDVDGSHARRRARSSTASVKQPSGAVATPAPTCPVPSLTCRIPVFTLGVWPSFATSRASTPTGVPRMSRVGSLNRLLVPWQTSVMFSV